MFTYPAPRKCLREDCPVHTCSLHPKRKAQDLPTVAKANNCPGSISCFSCACSPACPQLCIKHSINYKCTAATKLMANTNPAPDPGPGTACTETTAGAGQKAHLGSLANLIPWLPELLKPLMSDCHQILLTKPFLAPSQGALTLDKPRALAESNTTVVW